MSSDISGPAPGDRPGLPAASETGAEAGAGAVAVRPRRYRAVTIRALAHLAAWTPFVYALIRALRDGWRPVSDSAVIALRSWDSLTGNGLLVGEATRLVHGVYDLGPLQFWLLALPVHLDPATGVLWGAAVWCMVAASLAIEAAWATAGGLGAVLASGVILGIIGWLPPIAMLPVWNPWFATMFFLAALAAGWAVLSGRQRWWPVLVITASIAAQAHLMYAVAAACLVVVGLGAVIADSLRSGTYRWAITGVIVGVACWAAPVFQQFTGRPGNLARLIQAMHAGGTAKAGLTFGLRALSAATQPPPYWWRSALPALKLGTIDQRAAWFGAVAIAVIALALAVAIRALHSRRIAALAALSLLTALAALVTYAGIPASNLEHAPTDLSYLMAPMFPLGVLSWLAVGSVLMLGAWRARHRLRGRGAAQQRPALSGRAAAAWTGALAAVALMVTLTARAALHTGGALQSQSAGRKAVAAASVTIKRKVRAGRIALTVVAPNDSSRRQITMGLAYALRTAGYTPQISRGAFQLGPAYSDDNHPGQRVTIFVHDSGNNIRVVVGGRQRRGDHALAGQIRTRGSAASGSLRRRADAAALTSRPGPR